MAQTYGKKKTVATSTTHRDLFGTDEGDIENQLAGLSLESAKTPTSPPETSSRKSSRREQKETLAEPTRGRTPVAGKPSLVSKEDAAVIEPLLTLSESSVDLFSTFGAKLTKSFEIEKIGEGSFAEVFQLTAKSDSTTTSLSLSSSKCSVPSGGAIIKVIPLNTPSSDPNTIDRLSSVDSVAREIKVLHTLDSIHGFTRFRGIRLVTGLWPRPFLDAFRKFRRHNRKRAINRAPDDDFDATQIYALVEMDNVGMEISLIRRPSVFQVYDIFWMTAVLLANAEEQIDFEHRDLHLSNVCVKPLYTTSRNEQKSDTDSEGSKPSDSKLDIDHSLLSRMTESTVPTTKLGLSNLKLTIIDYTVTRCKLAPPTSHEQGSTSGEIAYDNMLFLSGGPSNPLDGPDAEANIQFSTYRRAKAAVELAQRRTSSAGDKWAQFVPQTNVVWLAYLLKVLSRRAKGRSRKYHVVKNSSKVAKAVQEAMWDVLATVEDVVLGVDPAEDDDDDERHTASAPVQEFTDDELERTPGSARELLARAVDEGWVDKAEIDLFKARLERDS